METKQHTIAIDGGLQIIRADVYRSLFFVHAMDGCCAMFAMFGVGKTKPFKVLHASENLSSVSADVWYLTTPKYIIFVVGEKFVSAMYAGIEGNLHTL